MSLRCLPSCRVKCDPFGSTKIQRINADLTGALARLARLCVVFAILGSGTVGCGTPAGSDTAAADVTVANGPDSDDDTGINTDDTGETDAGPTAKDTATAPEVVADCPGGFSCTCTTSEDCDSGYCIDGPSGQYCTKTCADVCPTGYKCVGTSVGSDVVNLCVPSLGLVCNPCKQNAECISPGHGGARCVDHGEAGAFCGLQCASDAECPDEYGCQDVTDVAGADLKQCVLKSGACSCGKSALAKELSTVCYKSVGAAKCAGERTCLADGKENAPPGGGLSACLAETPVPEKCDGLDNDCDGETDEATCDDSNTCTMDTCDAKVGCQYKHTAAPCNADDNPCTVADTCKSGKCEPGAAKPCQSGQACFTGNCSIDSGKCKFTNKDGFPCEDGDPCSSKGKCAGEICKTQPLNCDDNNACTADSCDKVTGCKHVVGKGSCEDGDPCTTGDSCAMANGKLSCFPGKKQNCDDNNSCTTDSCDAKAGCKNTANVGAKQTCYSGKPGSEKNAPCAEGIATCQANGTLGACVGEVVPAAKETCFNKIDDNCNGVADELCGKQSYVAGGRLVSATVTGTAGKYSVRGSHGASSAIGTATGTKHTIETGYYSWLQHLK